MPVIPALIIIYILAIGVVFFAFFTARIAQMKLRSPAWGTLGALLGPVGMLAVCYLPSRRKDGKETNPIRSGFRTLPGLSRKIFLILVILLAVALGAIYLIGQIPRWQENSNYEKSVGASIKDHLQYVTSVKGEPSAVAVGRDSTYLLTAQGDLYAWGYNHLSLYQQDKGAAAGEVLSVAQLGRDVYLLKKDKKLYKIDENGQQTVFADNVEKVACGSNFGALLKSGGDVFVWGSNAYNQLGVTGEGGQKPLWLCGSARDVSCGGRHMLILKKDGAVMGCGSNITGALGVQNETGNVSLRQIASGCSAVAAGGDFSLILTKDGVLKSAGANECGQLGRDTEQGEATAFHEVATGVTAMGAGGKFGWYIAQEKLFTWGQNHCGQLGQGHRNNVALPTQIMEKVTFAAASADHLAILSDQRLFVCGDNSYGQLGRPDVSYLTPATVVTIRK